MPFEVAAGHAAKLVLVFNQQDGFMSVRGLWRLLFLLSRIDRRLYARKIKPKSSAVPYRAFYAHLAAALLNDSVNGRKSKPRAFAFFFRGEKWLEDMAERFWAHSRAGILKQQHHVRLGRR